MIKFLLKSKPIDDSCWLFPVGIHGNKREASAFARRLAKKAIGVGSWDDASSDCAWKSVFDNSDLVVVSTGQVHTWTPGDRWWIGKLQVELKRVLEKQFSGIEDYREQANCRSQLYRQINGEYPGSLWSTLMLLDCNADDSRDTYCAGITGNLKAACDTQEAEWYRLVFGRIVFWLPEMERLTLRLYNNYSPEAINFDSATPSNRFSWADVLLRLSIRLGAPVDLPNDGHLPECHIVKELEAVGLLRIEDGRTISCVS